ncbi:MAG: biotin/lipoyl-containing protein [Planctomycetota bacterium]
MKTFVQIGERTFETEIVERAGRLEVLLDGKLCDVTYTEADGDGQVTVILDGRSYALSMGGDANDVSVTVAGYRYDCALEDERERAANLAAREASKGGGTVKAVMPGVVVELLVEEGDEVTEGQPLLILEAMKMQNEIGAPGEGVVKSIHASGGQAVGAGEKLVTLEAKPE